jgi:hypothetical protein
MTNTADTKTSKRYPTPTVYQIKRRVTNAPYFFDAHTMRFFGQTLKSFKVARLDNRHFLLSAPMITEGKYRGNSTRIFDAETCQFVAMPTDPVFTD